jgi:hypothetical protein
VWFGNVFCFLLAQDDVFIDGTQQAVHIVHFGILKRNRLADDVFLLVVPEIEVEKPVYFGGLNADQFIGFELVLTHDIEGVNHQDISSKVGS